MSRTPAWLDAMRQLWRRRDSGCNSGDCPENWGIPEYSIVDDSKIDDLHNRIAELLAESDRQRLQLWAKDEAIRILAERIVEMEDEDERN